MFQSFEATTTPEQGPARLAALRIAMAQAGVDGFLVPRADAWQGEYVAPCDERLAWLTGFTGSAGFCAVLADIAGVFIDGRYRVQVKDQVADVFTPVHWPENGLADWLRKNTVQGSVIAYDPWLHTIKEIKGLEAALDGHATLTPIANMVDPLWSDRPQRPTAATQSHPLELAGVPAAQKVADVAAQLAKEGQTAALLTLPDSICWLLNIRGSDIAHNPVVQAYALVQSDATVDLFIDPAKAQNVNLGENIRVHPFEVFEETLAAQSGPVRVDPGSAPALVRTLLGDRISTGDDPCVLPKACKNTAELDGARAAHQRDAVAMIEFLAWLDATAPGNLTEIDVVTALEGFRSATNALRDISFETISGAGPHGAIVHYRVTTDTNRPLRDGELLLVDSGGQYVDGTTDITRTIAIGSPGDAEKQCFTRVLQGMIAISRARFPLGISGRDLDGLARAPLWMAGQDYDHGTGHGVGSYLSVHEGPARISRASTLALKPGMILSNEPGYYREGAFGIRIENLIVVQEAAPTGDLHRKMLDFETLTYVPIDRNLVDVDMLAPAERDWWNAYHAEIAQRMQGQLSDRAAAWLRLAVAPL